LLASFQFAEYRISTRTDAASLLWARIGFIAITLLPVAGLDLVSLVSPKQHFLNISYGTAFGFVQLCADLWNHAPSMWVKMKDAERAVSFMTSIDNADMFAYFYSQATGFRPGIPI
jgi:hypothetical protein